MRTEMRVYCPRRKRAHEIARVTADSDGPILRYRGVAFTSPSYDPTAVLSPQDGWHYRPGGADATSLRPEDEVLTTEMWCAQCKIPCPANVNRLFELARSGKKAVRLDSRGHADGIWQRG